MPDTQPSLQKCPYCRGTGRKQVRQNATDHGYGPEIAKCRHCGGSGSQPSLPVPRPALPSHMNEAESLARIACALESIADNLAGMVGTGHPDDKWSEGYLRIGGYVS